MASKRSPLIFISFARGEEDEKLAERLARVLRERGYRTSPDDASLAPGANWALEMGKALASSDIIVAIVSKDYLRSTLAQKEWEFALTSPKHEHRVLPVILRGTPQRDVPWIAHNVEHVKAAASWPETERRVVSALEKSLGKSA